MFDYLKKILEQIRLMNESVDEYKKLSPSGAMPSVANVNKAVELIAKNELEAAEKILLETEQNTGGSDLIYRTLGMLYERRLDFKNVIKYFKKSLKLNPTKRDIIMRLGYAQLSIKRYEDAMETFERAVSLYPLDSEVFTARGMVLYRMERLEEARADFVKAFALDAHNLNALFLCATIDVTTGEYARAETRLSLLIKISPNTMNLYEYAKLKRLKKDFEQAEEYAKKSLATNKNFLPAYILLSEIYLDTENTDKALEILNIAQENELLSENFYHALGNVYLHKGDYESAKEAFTNAKIYGEDWNITVKNLICEILSGVFENKADEVIAYAESHDCKNDEEKALRYFLLGSWCYKNENYEGAYENLLRAVNLNLNEPVLYLLLAQSCSLCNSYKNAVECFESALEKNPKNYELHKRFIDYLISKEDWERVKYKVKNALKIFPEDTKFENALFIAGYKLIYGKEDEYNVKELIKLAEKLEKNSTFNYTDEKNKLLEKIRR